MARDPQDYRAKYFKASGLSYKQIPGSEWAAWGDNYGRQQSGISVRRPRVSTRNARAGRKAQAN